MVLTVTHTHVREVRISLQASLISQAALLLLKGLEPDFDYACARIAVVIHRLVGSFRSGLGKRPRWDTFDSCHSDIGDTQAVFDEGIDVRRIFLFLIYLSEKIDLIII